MLWTGRTGDKLIVHLGNNGELAVVAGGTITPLPGQPLNTLNVAW